MKFRRDKKGFTLVEMLMVVVIIGVLAAMVVPRFAGRSEEARRAAATADVRATLAGALDLYELDNGVYPTTEQGLRALMTAPATAPVPRAWKGPYLKSGGFTDPWGAAYIYRSPGRGGADYDLLSAGPDGVEGGADDVTSRDATP